MVSSPRLTLIYPWHTLMMTGNSCHSCRKCDSNHVFPLFFLPWVSFLFYMLFINCCVFILSLNICFAQLLIAQNENVPICMSLLYHSIFGFWYSNRSFLCIKNTKKMIVLIVSLSFPQIFPSSHKSILLSFNFLAIMFTEACNSVSLNITNNNRSQFCMLTLASFIFSLLSGFLSSTQTGIGLLVAFDSC